MAHPAINCIPLYMLYKLILLVVSSSQVALLAAPLGLREFLLMSCLSLPSGSTATVLCYPLDVIRTRMLSGKGEHYTSATSTIRTMLREERLASFYVGCLPAVVSTAASGAIFYGVYDILKTQYVNTEQRRRLERKGLSDEVVMGAGRTMLYGALAGAAAESILYPLEVLRRRFVLQLPYHHAVLSFPGGCWVVTTNRIVDFQSFEEAGLFESC